MPKGHYPRPLNAAGRPECAVPGCTSRLVKVGRCLAHMRLLSPEEVARIQNLSRADAEHEYHETKFPPPPPWEHEGDSDGLAQEFGGDQREA